MKRLFLFLILLLLATPASAAIARTGSCAATATTCTLSAVATGDLVIAFAFRSGSTTAPSADGSNTSLTTVSTSSGGTPGSLRVSCRKASSSGDTSSGTYTNATAVYAAAYSGTGVNATADCTTTGIGGQGATGNGTDWAKTSATASFPAVTFNGGSTSWAIGLLGGTGSSLCTPTGMTAVASSGTVRGLDTNTTASSWSTTTCSVTSETWMTYTLEIKVPQSFNPGAMLRGAG